MKIAMIGVSSRLGRIIAEECQERGMLVTAVLQPEDEDVLGWSDGLIKEFSALTAEDLNTFDVVVDAVDAEYCQEKGPAFYAAVLKHLTEIMETLPSVRLIVVGSAGGLYIDDSKAERVLDSMPEAQQIAALAMEEAAEKLKKSKTAWTYFRPAAEFEPEGKKTGKYLLSRDICILNSLSKCSISYADYAIALADEIENPSFCGKQFTAVSDTVDSMLDTGINFFDMTKGAMFTRFGSYMGIVYDKAGSRYAGQSYQTGKLYLGTRRGTPTDIPGQDNVLLRFAPMYRGHEVGYAIEMTPTELVLATAYGNIKICFAEDRLMYIQGENGLSLLLKSKMHAREVMKKRGEKAWEGVFRWRCSLVMNPLSGSIEMDCPWDNETMSTPTVRGIVNPDAEGKFLLAIEESVFAGKIRKNYPGYAQALADVTRDWETFLSAVPKLADYMEESRIEAAWTLWSFFINPSGLVKRPHILMTGVQVASSWQMGHNAAALQNNMPLAMDLMMNMIDSISPQGQLPDFVDDGKAIAQGIHPPTQGWAMRWIMRRHDLGKEVPRKDLEYLYDGYSKWVEWFYLARDNDQDGLLQCDNGDESGLDDCSPFTDCLAAETPDLSAYIAVLMDVLGDLADILGKPEEASNWHKRADDLTDLLIKTFWNGERFVALSEGTHEVLDTDSILHYMPFVLGKKLPGNIVDKMTADLMKEGEFLTPYGLASEKISSDHFRVSGFARGWIQPVCNLVILTGMYDAGKVEEAKFIAKRYCDACCKYRLPLLLNPLHGGKGSFASSWPACVFLTLADMLCNM